MLLLIGCNCTSFRVLLLDVVVVQYIYLESAIQCMLIPNLLIFFNFLDTISREEISVRFCYLVKAI